jgi:hypothetical protein
MQEEVSDSERLMHEHSERDALAVYDSKDMDFRLGLRIGCPNS